MTGAGLRKATAWTSPSVGLCRSGPAPVCFLKLKPRDPSRKPPLCEELDRVVFARSLRGRRGVQSGSQWAGGASRLPDRPARVRVRRSTEHRAAFFSDCKLRASRVLEAGSASIPTGAHTLGPRLSRSPTSPETFGVSNPRLLPFASRTRELPPRRRCAELRCFEVAAPVLSSVRLASSLACSASLEVPPSGESPLHPACHAGS